MPVKLATGFAIGQGVLALIAVVSQSLVVIVFFELLYFWGFLVFPLSLTYAYSNYAQRLIGALIFAAETLLLILAILCIFLPESIGYSLSSFIKLLIPCLLMALVAALFELPSGEFAPPQQQFPHSDMDIVRAEVSP